MFELLAGEQHVTTVSDKTLDFSDFTSRTWSGAAPTASSTLAPNGDMCQNFSASSSVVLDIDSKIGDGPFTIGAYIQPSSYQGQYGSSPPTGIVFQIGTFSGGYNAVWARPGTGTATHPKTISFLTFSDQTAPVGQWRHVAAAFDPTTRMCRLFVDGVDFNEAQGVAISSRTLSLGGLGDRPGITGSNDARYGYRGLMSQVRVRKGYQKGNFNPLVW